VIPVDEKIVGAWSIIGAELVLYDTAPAQKLLNNSCRRRQMAPTVPTCTALTEGISLRSEGMGIIVNVIGSCAVTLYLVDARTM
jgi:hypothetical protein